MVFCAPAFAAPTEYHAGLYTSYEYTDNYKGTADDEEGESIYEVGPSAQVIYSGGNARLDLTGHYAKTYHEHFTEDDSSDILFNGLYTLTTQKSSLNLGYGYTLTNRNNILSDVTGNSRIQTARAGYNRDLTSTTKVGLDYTYYQEGNTPPNEDIVSHGVTATLDQKLTQFMSMRLTNGYDNHRYEINSNAWVERSALAIDRQMSQNLTVGVEGDYQHQEEEDDDVPDADITSAFLTCVYDWSPATRLTLAGGYNWLDMKGMDRERTYALRAELRRETAYGLFSLKGSREYIAEFTVDRYGVYEARSVYLAWEKSLLRDLKLTSNITYEDRKPVSVNEFSPVQEDEQDYSALISLNWNPMRYLFITPSYEYYRRVKEHSDTEQENRYKVIAEVRY